MLARLTGHTPIEVSARLGLHTHGGLSHEYVIFIAIQLMKMESLKLLSATAIHSGIMHCI